MRHATKISGSAQRRSRCVFASKRSYCGRSTRRSDDRDRIAAEAAALTERLESLRTEFAALAGAEQQIEAMKQRAAEVAGTFAIETGRLDEVKLALREAAARLTEAQERLDRLQKDADALEARNILSRETLPDEIEKLRATLDELAKQRNALDLDISDLKGARELLFAARAERLPSHSGTMCWRHVTRSSAIRCPIRSTS